MPTNATASITTAFAARKAPIKGASHTRDGTPAPAFGFLLFGGALAGAQVSHIRLANELARRGYRVHVWWTMDRPHQSPLDPAISESWLFSAGRFSGLFSNAALDDLIGRCVCRMTPDAMRHRLLQQNPAFFNWILRGLIRGVCLGVGDDRALIRRFAAEVTQRGVTHILPTLECLAPFVAAVRPHVPYRLRYLVTFQGYELMATFARQIGQESVFYQRLVEAVDESDCRAITVSAAYGDRIRSEVGLSAQALVIIPPGVPTADRLSGDTALELVQKAFPDFRPEAPLISFVGRRDAEKGLDLLLYAARILKARGIDLQLAICGPTAFGTQYVEACKQIAWNLRIPVLWKDYVSDEIRSALFRTSRTVVYPSIHEEPFGMVPIESMVQGTPVVVPDTGGVAELIRFGDLQAGLHFQSWDSGDLAEQIERMLSDSRLHAQLAADGPGVAENFSIERHGERILDHLDLPHWFADRHVGRTPATNEMLTVAHRAA